MSFSLDKYLKELEELVNIDCGTYSLEGNKDVVDIVEKKYKELGFYVKRIDCGKAGIGLEVRNQPEKESIDVMLIGHLDTVFPVGTISKRPMTYDNEKAYGPGVSDMKAGILSIIYALRDMENSIKDSLSICICMNPDEETGSVDSLSWIENIAKKSKVVLVAEAARSDGGLVKARKGMARYKIGFKGRAAHAGNEPQEGRSSVVEMAFWIKELASLNNFETGTTLNVGIVSGGNGANVVPENAELILDIRFWKNEDYGDIKEKIEQMAKKSFTPDISISLVREAYKPSMLPSDKTNKLISLIEDVASELKIDISWKEVGGGSDANTTAILGIPTLDGLGPIGASFHSEDEYLLLESIEPRINLLRKTIERLAR